ncbi:hypothetical protein [Clostridium sp. UBA4548]|nr:hypothetical protein [Clostridium sp. UBA4548]
MRNSAEIERENMTTESITQLSAINKIGFYAKVKLLYLLRG